MELQNSEQQKEIERLCSVIEGLDAGMKLNVEIKQEKDRLIGELAEALKSFLAADNGGFETRHAAENSYCPDCSTDAEAWKDQTEHHAGCKYLARIEAAKAAVSKVTPSEKRNHEVGRSCSAKMEGGYCGHLVPCPIHK